jgi:sugar lactone lactonase YvrE
MIVEEVSRHRCELGEAPFWDTETGTLLSVDINAGEVHRFDPLTEKTSTLNFDAPLSFAIPTTGQKLIVGQRHRVIEFGPNGERSVLSLVEEREERNRLNDGKCDPSGRLLFGSMSLDRRPGTAALYRLDGSGKTKCLLSGLTLANGLDWNLGYDSLYFIDSCSQRIDLYDYDPDIGNLSNGRVFVQIDENRGLPDGLTVDAEGGVWVCLFGGSAIHRYSPQGKLDEVLTLPVSCPTSPTFGGENLDTIYVTTSRHRLSEERRAAELMAGATLMFKPGVTGRPASRFSNIGVSR